MDVVIAAHISEMNKRLAKAAEIAKAADACASAGSLDAAMDVIMDLDQFLYEATTLLNAASLMRRIAKAK